MFSVSEQEECLKFLQRITEGNGTLEDLDELEEIAATLKNQLSARSVRPPQTRFFPPSSISETNISRIVDKEMSAGVCKNFHYHRYQG